MQAMDVARGEQKTRSARMFPSTFRTLFPFPSTPVFFLSRSSIPGTIVPFLLLYRSLYLTIFLSLFLYHVYHHPPFQFPSFASKEAFRCCVAFRQSTSSMYAVGLPP